MGWDDREDDDAGGGGGDAGSGWACEQEWSDSLLSSGASGCDSAGGDVDDDIARDSIEWRGKSRREGVVVGLLCGSIWLWPV